MVVTDNVSARLVSEAQSVSPGSTFYVTLELDIREGWHTYWRNPGDSGEPTTIDWKLPKGVEASEIHWAFPERQYIGPVANYGYHGVAQHLVEISLPKDWPIGRSVELTADARWLVCEEECIPEKGQVRLSIDVSDDNVILQNRRALFDSIRATVPIPLAVVSSYQYSDDGQVRFEFEPETKLVDSKSLEYFPYDWGVVSAAAKQSVIIDNQFVSLTTVKGDLSFSEALQGILVAEQSDGSHVAYEVVSEPGVLNATKGNQHVESIDVAVHGQLSIFKALLFALLGGIILNLMPCVFPVLSMKALNLVFHAHEDAASVRKEGVLYTLGVLASFVILGVAVVVFKSVGEQIGWGFQLQSPVFVGVLILTLFVLGLSLSGYFEIGSSLMGIGSSYTERGGSSTSFFTGVLAVVVATPCTAPFMGPAIGFAFTQSTPALMSVLLALGLGLALPFLLFSFFPGLIRFLPKPGAWMRTFQQLLAFPMFASAAWLIWVLGQQSGINSIFAILLVLILCTFSIWLWHTTAGASSTMKLLARLLGLLLLVSAAVWFVQSNASDAKHGLTAQPANQVATSYQAFSAKRLVELREQGRPVFVNMTAAWCITCLANEKVALSSNELSTYFADNDITYLKGDWTNQDPEISRYLESFGRNSVPLYVYYPANSAGAAVTEPVVLPQILTVETVLDVIQSSAVRSTP